MFQGIATKRKISFMPTHLSKNKNQRRNGKKDKEKTNINK